MGRLKRAGGRKGGRRSVVCGLSQNLNENHFWFLAFSEDARGRGKGERAEGGNEERGEGGGDAVVCWKRTKAKRIYLFKLIFPDYGF